ncbi:hypothetical protein CYMTET_41957 [Cymbomonas tetramitiformis]|uniref:Uncharacterized protein n=1 Tax=Cymbomonas tetramitiformis TaxID=36881 RepID=A0AAE0C514_9CHLO|nr:hypothetical protein CYMTET_41957 [Cymbomonas tetramitiformis]
MVYCASEATLEPCPHGSEETRCASASIREQYEKHVLEEKSDFEKYLVYRTPGLTEGGWGNRVNALLASFTFAIVTGRHFLLDWGDDATLKRHTSHCSFPFLEPPGILWDIGQHYEHFDLSMFKNGVSEFSSPSHRWRVSDTQSRSVGPGSWRLLKHTREFNLGAFLREEKLKDLTQQYIFVENGFDFTQDLVANPQLRETWESLLGPSALSASEWSSYAMHFLFSRPSADMQAMVSEFKAAHNWHAQPVWGVQIRTLGIESSQPMVGQIIDHADLTWECVREALSQYQAKQGESNENNITSPTPLIYFASDMPELGERLEAYLEGAASVIQVLKDPGSAVHSSTSDDCKAVHNTIVDWFLLGETSVMVENCYRIRRSTFPESAGKRGGMKLEGGVKTCGRCTWSVNKKVLSRGGHTEL